MALVACVLWLAGFEVLPWMHIALHDQVAPHHHDATGAMILDAPGEEPHHDHHYAADNADDDDVDAEVDEHGAPIAHATSHHVADAHDHDDADDNDEDDDADAEVDEHGAPIAHPAHAATPHHTDVAELRLANALGHGRHSLAHHDIAISSPPPAVIAPLPVHRRVLFVLAITSVEPISFSPGRAVARGPPQASTT